MVEILSPAGNIAALKSAVANRADAVYLGVEQFNARLKADNFSTQNLKEWVEFCHLYSTKVYVTVNTLIKEKELPILDEILIACENAKVDAIIVADLAVVPKAAKLCPSVSLHASTQMGVHNYLGAKLLEELGFSRVVLSRECKIEDIKSIKQHTNLEIEYFVHGAMCVSFSGSCLLSSISGGNSGNRGLCLQPCRKEYNESLTGSKGYLISPKDQCLIENLQDLIYAGVDSFKIEGRLKSAEYVGLVTAKYKKAIESGMVTNGDICEMKRAFNRGGFSKGYAFTSKDKILYTKSQNHIGEKIGEVLNCVKTKDYFKIEIKSDFNLKNGDGVKIMRNDCEVGGFEISIIESKDKHYKLYSKYPFGRGDSVHITYDSDLSNKYLVNDMPKITVEVECSITCDNVEIAAIYKNHKIEYSEKCNFDSAINNPTAVSDIKNSLEKTGNTPFEFAKIGINIQDNLFIPKSVINNIRRNFVEFLRKEIIRLNSFYNTKSSHNNSLDFGKKYQISSIENSDIIIADKIDFDSLNCKSSTKIVLNYNNFDKSILNYAKNHNNLYIKLPKIAMTADVNVILKFMENLPKNVGVYADSLYHYYIAVSQGRNVIGGMGLNLYNSESVKLLGLKSFVASSELSKNEIEDIGMLCAVFTLGYLPVMYFCHCPVQHFTNCKCDSCKYKPYYLSDKYGEYKVKRVKIINCYFEMLNSNCHFIPKDKLGNEHFACIDVSEFENSTQIANNYLNSSCFILSNSIKLTKGHYFRGVK